MGCLWLPLKHLGLPLGANPSRRLTWRSIVENFKKLSGWKRRVLSFPSRVTLIKSALSALPVYYISLFKMPECVAKEIDRIQASFLWDVSEHNRKLHLIRYGQEDKALWELVICDKYGSVKGRWYPDQDAHGPISQIWKDILSLVNDKKISLSIQVTRRSSQSGWGFNFRRALQAWKEDELVILITALGTGPVLRSDSVDCFGWKSSRSGIFQVNLVYAWGLINDGPSHKSVDLI
ncbi:uncharacterized protein LOC114302752 [Camellia sinensis]|uniref:uncharacterized protein LOC114302752 n=1 Tax=Camellia sinensis TaxID=4442 RepID=UPI001035818F|nr:uncharacterized protein LOC114302752 [Camellia sinensis]